VVVESGGLSAVNILVTSTQPLQADSFSDNEMGAEVPVIDIHHAASSNAHNSAAISTQLDPILPTNPSTNYINVYFGQRRMKPMPAMMPTRFPMIDRNNFQPLFATTFVGGMPISSGDPSSLSFERIMRRKSRNPNIVAAVIWYPYGNHAHPKIASLLIAKLRNQERVHLDSGELVANPRPLVDC
jgi:hypothetical protein